MNSLAKYCVRLGDNSLILSHRLSEYCSKGPYLEEDLAISNVGLDLLGQGEQFLTYACEVDSGLGSPDSLFFKRPEGEFLNVQLVENPNTDFAYLTTRNFFMDVFNYFLYTALANSSDERIAGIAAKSIKEVAYHVRRSSEWMVRLGDGTKESHERIQTAVDNLWKFTGELFESDEVEQELVAAGVAADPAKIKGQWNVKVDEVFAEAVIKRPEDGFMISGGRNGHHSEYMGYMLADFQFLNRAYPNANW